MGVRNAVVTHNPLQVNEGDPARTGPQCGSAGFSYFVVHSFTCSSEACSVELTAAIPDLARMTDLGIRPRHMKW